MLKKVTTDASDLITAFSVFGALGGFFSGLRGERLPGGGNFLFWQKRKVTKESCLGSGDELNALTGHCFARPLVL